MADGPVSRLFKANFLKSSDLIWDQKDVIGKINFDMLISNMASDLGKIDVLAEQLPFENFCEKRKMAVVPLKHQFFQNLRPFLKSAYQN